VSALFRTTDSPEVEALLASENFTQRASELAGELNTDPAAVLGEAAAHLREMSAIHDRRVSDVWQRFGRWMTRGYDLLVDDDALADLRRLDRRHSLIFLISHRSYLDEFVLPPALAQGNLSPLYGIAGGNLNFFPLGDLARRNGIVHVRRSTADVPVYRFALREYMGRLVTERANLCWSIEGGRTRTGKLRPPRYGLLRYVADAVGASAEADPLLVPVSMMYDQIPIHEVGRMASEARGQVKEAEDLRWLVRYASGLRERRGRIYLDFGTPLNLRDRLDDLNKEAGTENRVERIALDVCHRLNAATPITPTAAVCIALLAEDRALTLDEVLATVQPFADYVAGRGWPVAGAANLTDRSTLRWALRELVRSGVLSDYRGGTETVYSIARDQHLVAAFYRNSVLHVLLLRAIAELTLLALAEGRVTGPDALATEGLRLRDLLKFDFFFAPREEFLADLAAEVGILSDGGKPVLEVTTDQAELWLSKAELRVAPLVLRPFLDAYRVIAGQLVELADEAIPDEELVVRSALRVGRQWALQRSLASEESVSGEMFRTALKLAAHRALTGGGEDVERRRQEFADEVAGTSAAIVRLGSVA
jgi:glycerol-3-phosphate O-acyltransferase